MVTFKNLTLFLVLSLVMACSSGVEPFMAGLGRASSGDTSDSRLNERADGSVINPEVDLNASAGKASDEDEGIPGYLRQLDEIAVRTIDVNQIQLEAPAGTAYRLGPQMFLNVWTLDPADLIGDKRIISDQGRLSAIQIGSVMANMDGSFRIDLPLVSDRLVVVAVDDEPQPATMDFIVDDFAIFGGIFVERENGPTSSFVVSGVITSNVQRMEELIGAEKADEIIDQDFATSREQRNNNGRRR